jgi:Thioesterase-like superfamily
MPTARIRRWHMTASNIPCVADSFYIPLDDGLWRATPHTIGPWDTGIQHGGPPCALLGRAMQRCQPRAEMMITRFTCEILRAIPVGDLSVRARLARQGRSVELVEATASMDGREVARAAAWRILRTTCPPVKPRLAAPPPLPDGPPVVPPATWAAGYISAIEWRRVGGSLDAPGPATLWARMRYPLVPDEEPTPLDRVLAVADSGNGASWELDMSRWLFINPELTVHLHREAAGEWICLDAQTAISTGGAGLATSVLSDLDGPVGVGAQCLLIAPRAAWPA